MSPERRLAADSALARAGAISLGVPPRLLAGYDAAEYSDRNQRLWFSADALSPDTQASPEVRDRLRRRGRYEIANNAYAYGMTEQLVCDVIGTGPRLRIRAPGSRAARAIEHRFAEWSRLVGLVDKLCTMRRARIEAGESVALFVNNPGLASPVRLDLRLFEAEELSSGYGLTGFGLEDNEVDGVLFDEAGNPREYRILRSHPGDMVRPLRPGYDTHRAERVIHYYRPRRARQSRGVPDITPALPLFAQLRAYTLNVLQAAHLAANMAGVLQTDAPAQDIDPGMVEPFDFFELEAAGLTTLPAGWTVQQMRAEQPATTYSAFKHEILKEAARVFLQPIIVADADSSSSNFASAKLDTLRYNQAIAVDREHLSRVVLDRIFRAWLDEAVLVSGYLPISARTLIGGSDSPEHVWMFDGAPVVDPEKKAMARERNLKTNMTSLAREYGEQGLDWEREIEQIAEERRVMDRLGLSYGDAVSRLDRDADKAGRRPEGVDPQGVEEES